MAWRFWQPRSTVTLRVLLGYNLGSWAQCVNILIEHKVRPVKFTLNDDLPRTIGAGVVKMTLFDPGERKLNAVVAALNNASFGCSHVSPFPEP